MIGKIHCSKFHEYSIYNIEKFLRYISNSTISHIGLYARPQTSQNRLDNNSVLKNITDIQSSLKFRLAIPLLSIEDQSQRSGSPPCYGFLTHYTNKVLNIKFIRTI